MHTNRSHDQWLYDHSAFYGIWCAAAKDEVTAQSYANILSVNGYDGQVMITTDWSNLNTEYWYVVTAGTYETEQQAYNNLAGVQNIYPDAYIKYSGSRIGKS